MKQILAVGLVRHTLLSSGFYRFENGFFLFRKGLWIEHALPTAQLAQECCSDMFATFFFAAAPHDASSGLYFRSILRCRRQSHSAASS